MADKITRYNGNLEAFASNATGDNRRIFNDPTNQSNDITANITAAYLTGLESFTDSVPKRSSLNGLYYTHGQILAYLHQMGIPEWNASQEYFIGSVAIANNAIYLSLTGTTGTPNIGNDPTTATSDWSPVPSLNNFSQTVATDGRLVLPNGITFQWASITTATSDYPNGKTGTFPVAFGNACLFVVACDSGGGANIVSITPISTTQFTVWSRDYLGAGALTNVRYLAIGY